MIKKLYDVNQILKNNPYWYEFENKYFVGDDLQSKIFVIPKNLYLENPFKNNSENSLFIENGKELYKFISDNKKLDSEGKITKNSIDMLNEKFPVKYTKLEKEYFLPHLDKMKYIDGTSISLYYDDVMVKEKEVLISDIVDTLALKRKEVENEFVYLEIKGSNLYLHKSVTKLDLQSKALICLNNFVKLKTKKRSIHTEFFRVYPNEKNKISIHYGNDEYEIIYIFNVYDF